MVSAGQMSDQDVQDAQEGGLAGLWVRNSIQVLASCPQVRGRSRLKAMSMLINHQIIASPLLQQHYIIFSRECVSLTIIFQVHREATASESKQYLKISLNALPYLP